MALLSDIRVGHQPGFDRLVFEFGNDQVPAFELGYTDDPTAAGSGDPLEVAGDAFLAIRMEPASGVDLSGDGQPTYVGPQRFDRSDQFDVILEVVRSGDFEANLEWVIGLGEERPFDAYTLTDPVRVVVEVSSE